VQEIYEIFLLKKSGLVDDNSIIVNGSCGDFISGGHVKAMSNSENFVKGVNNICWDKFLEKHYSLWGSLRGSLNDKSIISELNKLLLKRIGDYDKPHYSIMEYCEFIGRQSKIVMGQQRTYEYFGYDWRMPLWSNEMLSFWEGVPYKYKINQYLYFKTLNSNNWGGVWTNIKTNDKLIKPAYLRWLRALLKIMFIFAGKARWHRFEKNVLEYFLHPSYALTVVPYSAVLFDMKRHRGANSWLSRQMVKFTKK
jgi:asparagine synthase (glutamine-hydrolysing)